MKTILVSLVSDQTIPNILAIHHIKPDELLFITTKDMEKKQKIQSKRVSAHLLRRATYSLHLSQ
jgi:hypothetical protein